MFPTGPRGEQPGVLEGLGCVAGCAREGSTHKERPGRQTGRPHGALQDFKSEGETLKDLSGIT